MKSDNVSFSLKEIKKIITDIIIEETSSNDLNITVYPITKFQYVLDRILTKKYKIYNASFSMAIDDVRRYGGIYQNSMNAIIVFLRGFDKNFFCGKVINNDCHFADLILTSYHESRHVFQFQEWSKKLDYRTLILNMEDLLKFELPEHYDVNHDFYYSEIDANLYGVKKTKEFFGKYPNVSDESRKYLDYLQSMYSYQIINYDFDSFFTDFCRILCLDKSFINRYGDWLKIFFDNNCMFKNIHDIFSNRMLYSLNSELVSAILSSDAFLMSADLSNLNDVEYNIMNNCFSYKHAILQKKYDSNVEHFTLKTHCSRNLQRLENFREKMSLDGNKKFVV